MGVSQKSILATCNYEARRRGVKKLSLISDARRACPELVVINGEDLTPFRDASKRLYGFLRSFSWNNRVERLGLDEVFLDVSDIVAYNAELLNSNALGNSFFQLDRADPEKGFAFDASVFAGCVWSTAEGREAAAAAAADPSSAELGLLRRLIVGSHLALHLRHSVENEFGFTASCGISTSKMLAKLVGGKNKPRNQTTLLALRDEDVHEFVGEHRLRKIPGCGSKITHALEGFVLSRTTAEPVTHSDEAVVTARDARAHPDMSPRMLEELLGGPGVERGIGHKVWGLLHGVDNSEVKEGSEVPVQISIEDSYRGLDTFDEVKVELRKLAASLIRRMRVDLVEEHRAPGAPVRQRWMAYPRTLRLSTRQRTRPSGETKDSGFGFNRMSRSQPLPSFVFSLSDNVEHIAEKLVAEALIHLFRRLHSQRTGLDLSLINVCVTNMSLAGNQDGSVGGRDISVMFKTQDDVLSQWRVKESPTKSRPGEPVAHPTEDTCMQGEEGAFSDEDCWEDAGDDQDLHQCQKCGHSIPLFAVSAHARYHEFGD